MLTVKYLKNKGLPEIYLALFKKHYRLGMVVDADNVCCLQKTGVPAGVLAYWLFDIHDFFLYHKLTEPTKAWHIKRVAETEYEYETEVTQYPYDVNKLDLALKKMNTLMDEVEDTLSTVEASIFVRIYSKVYSLD